MAIIVAKTREELIQQVKDIGQTIIDRAEDILGNIDHATNVRITAEINYKHIPTITMSKEIYVHRTSPTQESIHIS